MFERTLMYHALDACEHEPDFYKLIGFKIVYWTFDSTLNKSHYISTNDFRMDLVQRGAEDITLETNGKLIDDNFGERGHLIQFNYFLNHIHNG